MKKIFATILIAAATATAQYTPLRYQGVEKLRAWADSMIFTTMLKPYGSIVPGTDSLYNFGSGSLRFKTGFFAGGIYSYGPRELSPSGPAIVVEVPTSLIARLQTFGSGAGMALHLQPESGWLKLGNVVGSERDTLVGPWWSHGSFYVKDTLYVQGRGVTKIVFLDTLAYAQLLATGKRIFPRVIGAAADTFRVDTVTSGGGGTITVEGMPGGGQVTDVTKIRFDTQNGFVVYTASPGVAGVLIPTNASMTFGSVSAGSFATNVAAPYTKLQRDTIFIEQNDSTGALIKMGTQEEGNIVSLHIPTLPTGTYTFAFQQDIFVEDSTAWLNASNWDTSFYNVGANEIRGPWNNPGNVAEDDDQYATVTENGIASKTVYSDTLWTDSIAVVPSGVTGIKLRFELDLTNDVNVARIRLRRNGVQIGQLKSIAASTSGLYYAGDENDLWGAVWSQGDTLGIQFQTSYAGGLGHSISIDEVAPKIYFQTEQVTDAVDSIWRTPGKDSIQFSISGRYRAIKDSAGTDTSIVAGAGIHRSTSGNVITLDVQPKTGGSLVITNDSTQVDSTGFAATDYDVSQRVAKSDMAAKLVYTARISQSGTNAPTAAGAVNKTGQSATYGYQAAGDYSLTFGAAIATTADNIKVLIQSGGANPGTWVVNAYAASTTVIDILSADTGFNLTDDILTNATIQVWVDTP